MERVVTAAPLAKDQIGQAYPLIRALMPELDLAGWTRLAKKVAAGGAPQERGILAVRNESGYLCGLCFYSVEHADTGAKLIAEHFVAFDVTERTPIAGALIAAIDELARSLGCVAVHTWLDAKQQPQLERFRDAGYEPRRILVCKELRGKRAGRRNDA
jgi:hypothetical protein